jgi:hypothetical protein
MRNQVPISWKEKDENSRVEEKETPKIAFEMEKIQKSKRKQMRAKNDRQTRTSKGLQKSAEKTGNRGCFLRTFLKPLGGAPIKEPYRSYFLEH